MYFIWIFLYGFIYMIAERISLLFSASHLIVILIMSLYWGFFFACLHRKGAFERYGICLPQHRKITEYLLYAPLFLMPFINLAMAALSSSITKADSEVIWGIPLMIYYSFGEEVLFRGGLLSIFTKQYKTNVLQGTIVTSLMFSALHLINIYSSTTVRYAVIQSLCAGAMGVCFGIIVCREKSIIPCVIIHSLINITSLISDNRNILIGEAERADLSRFEMKIYLILAAIYLFYGICLYYEEKSKKYKGERT